jgi:7-keto-8-aminopelargonate synthetase-like enzyme
VIPFPHGDYAALEALLVAHRGRYNGAGILTDGVFSTKGSVADIDQLVALAKRHTCLSVVDDTHGTFVLGKNGRGVLDLFESRPDVLTGGFGKGLGSFGGFAVSNRALGAVIDILGRQNVNSSFMSPIVAAQSLIHLRYYRAHQATLAAELARKLRVFNDALGAHGLACYPDPDDLLHPVFCLYKERELDTLACQSHLIEAGFLPSFFPPPVAPYPSLRMSLHRCLPESELVRLAGELGTLGLFVDAGGRLGAPRTAPVTRPRIGAPAAA